MTQHVELMIVKGLPKVSNDTLSAEVGLDDINLLKPEGLSLDEKGWVPKVAQVRNGGQYADSMVSDTDSLIAAARGRVVEQMNLTASGSNPAMRFAMLSKLQKFAKDAENFHTTKSQIEPVYLRWKAPGAPAPQYALIYSIDIAPTLDAFIGLNSGKFSITITREAAWRGLPPGDNPRRWHIENVLQVPFTTSNSSLIAGTDHTATATIINGQEFATLSTFGNVNFVDVPASRIPGDAPALVTITLDSQDGFSDEVYISKSINRTSIADRAGASNVLYNAFAAAAANIGSATAVFTTSAGNGLVHTPVSPNKRIVTVTPVGATEINILNWIAGATFPHLNTTVLRGTYALFLRGNQAGGTAGQTTFRVEFNSSAGVFFDSGQTILGLAGTESPLHYLGVVSIPYDTHSQVAIQGNGLQVEYDFNLKLYSTRSAGASTHIITDIILMPMQEGMVYINPDLYVVANNFNTFDNTGYLTHGKQEPVATCRAISGVNEFMPQTECKGDLMLTPGVNNRLYFLCHYKGGPTSVTNGNFTPRINIVPRWFGVRDS